MGQPDNFEGPENCVHLYVRDDRDNPGTWNDNECDKTYGFICRKPKGTKNPNEKQVCTILNPIIQIYVVQTLSLNKYDI